MRAASRVMISDDCENCIGYLLSNWGHGTHLRVDRAQESIQAIWQALPDEKQENIDLKNELNLLIKTLNSFKNLSCPQKKEKINLNELAAERYSRYLTFYQSNGILFELRQEHSGLFVHTSWLWLGRLLDSLVDNAVEELMQQEDRRIQMTTRTEGQFAQWIIEDNGRGMPREQFENKIHLKPEALEERGRGLFLANQLITFFQGTLEQGEITGGTKMIVSLPLQN
jgi:C4-dicarboxylate-specific signal transduction histidine kinase